MNIQDVFSDKLIRERIKQTLKLKTPFNYHIIKRSIDARRRPPLYLLTILIKYNEFIIFLILICLFLQFPKFVSMTRNLYKY